MRRSGFGFSLVELLVVLAIMGVLASVAAPLTELAWKRERESELRAALRDIRSALDAYKRAVDEGRIESQAGASGYPPSLELLVQGVPDKRSAAGDRLYFLRRLPSDPLGERTSSNGGGSGDDVRTAAQSWGLRSYASSAHDPRRGVDVFDVFSRSDERGLDGRRYRDW